MSGFSPKYHWYLGEDEAHGAPHPSSYGYAEPDKQRVTRRKKRPLGFVWPEQPVKSRPKARRSKRSEQESSA